MGLLDGLIGGFVGGEMATAVNTLIAKHGGLSGIVQQFEAQGFSGTIKSWVGTGANLPISPDELQKALGSDTIKTLAAKLGMDPDALASKLSSVLPTVVDRLTPGGIVPPGT